MFTICTKWKLFTVGTWNVANTYMYVHLMIKKQRIWYALMAQEETVVQQKASVLWQGSYQDWSIESTACYYWTTLPSYSWHYLADIILIAKYSWSINHALVVIEAGATSKLGHKNKVAKNMHFKLIKSLKQNYPQQQHENKHTTAHMSWQYLYKISDFLKISFNIKKLWNQSVFRKNMKFSVSTDLWN